MEIRVLRYFLEVAREGSVTHAAQRLHISQPTLSKQLKDLEAELGKKLFVRSSFSVRLTEEGMLLRKRAEDILAMVDKTSAEFKALGQVTGGDIHIGYAESENIKHLARRIKAVQERCPGIRFHLYSGDTNDLAERLNVTVTINLTYNGSVMAREGLGCVLTFDRLADTSQESELCFRPLTPRLETKLYLIWKKYQVFAPAAGLFLEELKTHYTAAASE